MFVGNKAMNKSLQKVIDIWTDPQEVLLRAGEMEEQELRTAMAVLNGFARDIRRTLEMENNND